MSLEREQPEISVQRENFGPGTAGEWAYQTISGGTSCVAFIDEDKTECGQTATGTVDVDIRGDLDLFPHCTDEHAKLLTDQLVLEIENYGGYTVPSRNGFGRA